MFPDPKRPEIDHRTLKLIVGVIAISLASLTSFFATTTITSISASDEMLLSKVAAGAALGVALFPCGCNSHIERIPYIHGVSAAIMFLILAYFCYKFSGRANGKKHPQAKVRAKIYDLCGIAIVLAILVLAIDNLSGGFLSAGIPDLHSTERPLAWLPLGFRG
jgi:heme A synthase